MIDECSAIVVAGGRGARLGDGPPKALRQLGGRTLLERMIERATTWSDDVIVSAPPGMDLPPLAARVVRDAAAFGPWAGPLVALGSALSDVERPWAIAIAVDLPLVRDELISLLWARRNDPATALANTPAHAEPLAVIPLSARGPEPLCALYRPAAAPILLGAAQAGERAVMRVSLSLPHIQVSLNEVRGVDGQLESFTNLNTPDEWARAEKLILGV